MARDKRNERMWEEGFFEDISSDSHRSPQPFEKGPVQRPAEDRRSRQPQRRGERDGENGRESRPVRRRPQQWEVPQWDVPPPDRVRGTSRSRPSERERPRGSGSERRNEPAGPRKKKRAKKPLSNGARRAMVALTVLMMAAVTVLLAVFLLFKVSEIRITGDLAEGYLEEDVLNICGYKVGDNLFFLTTRDKEQKLKEQMPYIEDAKIIRHLPGTLEIQLIRAEVASCVSYEGGWLYTSAGGKILEKQDKPQNGVIQVFGLTLPEAVVGREIWVDKPDGELPEVASGDEDSREARKAKELREALNAHYACVAYRTVLKRITELEAAGDFTLLDLSDLSNIRLIYQDRVEFLLGSSVELEYKIGLGLTSVEKWEQERPGTKARGVMNLSTADETKRAYFTEGEIGKTPAVQEPGGQVSSQPEGNTSSGSQTGSEPSSSPSGDEDYRDQGIPDSPFTGGSDTGDDGDAGDTGYDDGTGDTGYDDGDAGDGLDQGGGDGGDTGDGDWAQDGWTGDE